MFDLVDNVVLTFKTHNQQQERIDPEQRFFPRPDEVAAEIKRQALKKVPSHVYARG